MSKIFKKLSPHGLEKGLEQGRCSPTCWPCSCASTLNQKPWGEPGQSWFGLGLSTAADPGMRQQWQGVLVINSPGWSGFAGSSWGVYTTVMSSEVCWVHRWKRRVLELFSTDGRFKSFCSWEYGRELLSCWLQWIFLLRRISLVLSGVCSSLHTSEFKQWKLQSNIWLLSHRA